MAPIIPKRRRPRRTSGTVTRSFTRKMRKRYFVRPNARSTPSIGSADSGGARVEEVHAVLAAARLGQPDLKDVADGRIEQVDDRNLETALRIDGEGRRVDAPADGPLMERPLRDIEQYRRAEWKRIGELPAEEGPVELRPAALEEQ